jgi:precorrin-3B methylase
MGCRSIARINSLVFTNKLVSLTYGVCAMASGAIGLGAPRRMDFVSIMLSEIRHSSIAIPIVIARLITSRGLPDFW